MSFFPFLWQNGNESSVSQKRSDKTVHVMMRNVCCNTIMD